MRRRASAASVLGLVLVLCGTAAQAASLDHERRVAAHRAVERVLWERRIWPEANPEPKPPLEAVLPESALRAKVEEVLRRSNALAALWHRPVGPAELQAEIERMTRDSQAPDTLEAMFDAVDRDPVLVAEVIARPVLVDRLIHAWYARDPRFHVETRARAERDLSLARSAADLARLAPRFHELEKTTEPLGRVDRIGPLEETDTAFTATVGEGIASWPKTSFEAWWSGERAGFAPALPDLDAAALSAIPVPAGASCADDTWTPIPVGTPPARWFHTAVWTGTEMIVWGGINSPDPLNTGGRYSPATDSWARVTKFWAPSARTNHAAVWSGTRMVVWGGLDASSNAIKTGGRYDPITDTWLPTATAGAPAERIPKVAVWTGSRMIVWGGNILLPGSGGQYDPVADTWTATSTTGAPSDGGSRPEGVWTGSQMIVWPGARYDPVANAWSAISGAGEPVAQTDHTVVWTGSRMIVWGGYSGNTPRNDGGVYDPATDTWSATSLVGAPSSRGHHVAAWVQNRMVIWGGDDNSGPATTPMQTGGRYDPATNTWSPTTLTGAPERRFRHTAVATAGEMIVWGGYAVNGVVSTGGRYNPASDSWVPTRADGPAPSGRWSHSLVWTGTEAIAWGGFGLLGDGARYAPATDSWLPMTTTGAPEGRADHTAIWTGTRMIIWGGGYHYNSGGRYDPITDSWTPTSLVSVPVGRGDHTAVWTGTRMIVWGGDEFGGLNSGGMYDPAADSWTPTATAGAPAGRTLHTAVWTGSRMIVWGGWILNGAYHDSGGLYDPASNTWTPTATSGAPSSRKMHVSVWTGSRMLVWGGAGPGEVELGTGASYDSATNTWTPLPTAGAPPARYSARAIWSGAEMIVWGGGSGNGFPVLTDTGGRYRPADDSWRSTSLIGAPDPRTEHGAVWTGDEMIVWGGYADTSESLNDGGRYCACTPWYPDLDGDGFGDLFNPVTTCDGTAPAGLIGRGGDCHDGNAAIHPGVADDTCNEVDEDCDNQLDEDFLVQPTLCGAGVCRDFGALECIGGQLVNTCVPRPPNSAVDDTCNNLDDDCEGGVDEEFPIYIDQWIPIASAPVSRTNYTAVSSGTEFLVFGGDNGSGVVQTGGVAYDLAANTWRSLPVGPAKRWHHTAVWADTRMIVWGGDDGAAVLYNNGSRYDPVANTWAATTTTGAPIARGGHSAVWTGSRMVIWGGRDVGNHFNTGSRYDPVANTWSATTTTGAPTARWLHTAVWTGTQMLVWGGQASTNAALNTGGRYDPSSNTWTPISTANAPSARYGHVAVWTGTEMFVWGGTSAATTYLASGARYNPSTDTWTTMATADAPSRRAWASAVWNGYEFVVWGGTYRTNEEPDTALGDGGKYYPGNNVWIPINPFSTAPTPRARTMAVLQAGEMIVWGGDPNGGALASGARHVPFTFCGVGGCQRLAQTSCSGGTISFQCTPGTPQPEICDGYDNDCNATIDDVPVPTGSPTMFGTKLIDNTIVLTWSAIPNATAYDMVRGSLVTLRATGGDFTTATCIQNDNPMTQGWDVPVAPPGDGTWYLVRPVNSCAGNGSYDGPSPPQQGSRDAELGACP